MFIKKLYIHLSISLFYIHVSAQNTWVQKSDYSPGGITNCISFAIGNKAYVGLGYDGSFNQQIYFYEYDAAGNTWSQKADFPGAFRATATSCAIGNKGYVRCG